MQFIEGILALYAIVAIFFIFGLFVRRFGARMLRIDEIITLQKDILEELKKQRPRI
jgi:hypothetical protein